MCNKYLKLNALTYDICWLQAFQDEFDSRRSTLNTLQQTANPEDPAVLQQLSLLNDLWTKVEGLSHDREHQLNDNLKSVSIFDLIKLILNGNTM